MKKHTLKTVALICGICAISQTSIAQSWSTTGNAGTNSSTNFIGTTDNVNFKIRTKNNVRLTISAGGRVGIGITNPVFKLDVQGGSINTDSMYRINGYPMLRGNGGTLAVGQSALGSSTNTGRTTAVGVRAMFSANGAFDNTAVGFEALYSLTAGEENTAVGSHALRDATGAFANTAVGQSSLSNTTAGSNTAVGAYSLTLNTIGISNCAFGSGAMNDNTTAGRNVSVGSNALRNQSYDNGGASWNSNNVAVGFEALYFNEPTTNVNGYFNTAIGCTAMRANTTGYNNTAAGSNSLFSNTTGINLAAMGAAALQSNTTGSGNTALGFNANVSSGNLMNATVIGSSSSVNASNKMQLGSSTTTLATTGGITIVSDGRFKEDVKAYDVPGLDFIKQLRPVTYNFNYKKFDDFLTKDVDAKHTDEYFQQQLIEKGKHREVGFIAQEVDHAVSEKGFTFNGVYTPQNNNDNYALDYSRFVVPLVKAVQEMDKASEELRIKNEKLENEIAQIKSVMTPGQKQMLDEIHNGTSKAALDQNIPNPFNKTTTIKYKVPAGFSSAELKIYSMQGAEIKSFPISSDGSGEITVGANTLSTGIYSYTLIVDGQAADIKQMIVTK